MLVVANCHRARSFVIADHRTANRIAGITWYG